MDDHLKRSRDALVVDLYYNWWKFGLDKQPLQSTVAQMLDMHEDTVSKTLKKGLSPDGFAEVQVDYSGACDAYSEDEICRIFPNELNREAVRVMGIPRGFNGSRRVDVVRRLVGQGAAQLLMKHVIAKASDGEMAVGISWGRQLRCMVDAMPRIQAPPHTVHIVPTVGGFGGGDLADIESGALVSDMCHRLGFGRCHSLPAPGYVRNRETQQELLTLPLTREIIGLWKSATIVSGIGSIDPKATSLALWRSSGLNPKQDLPLLREISVVGDLSLQFFTESGGGLPTDDPSIGYDVRDVIQKLAYPISATLADLKRAAKDKNRLSLVVGAGKAKALPLYYAIRAGFVSGLVIDEDAADEIRRIHSCLTKP